MALPDKSIDPRLFAAAKAEFLEKGYEMAQLKDMCKAAGVTTGALYNRYKGKDDLFAACVKDAVQALQNDISKIEEMDLSQLSDQELYDLFSMKPEVNKQRLLKIYEHKEEFILLTRCAAGSQYENFLQDLGKRITFLNDIYYHEAKRRNMITKEISAKERHALNYSIWSLFYEPFLLDFTWEELEQHAVIISEFIDWYKVIGMCLPQ